LGARGCRRRRRHRAALESAIDAQAPIPEPVDLAVWRGVRNAMTTLSFTEGNHSICR
jgi:hypothetical protein